MNARAHNQYRSRISFLGYYLALGLVILAGFMGVVGSAHSQTLVMLAHDTGNRVNALQAAADKFLSETGVRIEIMPIPGTSSYVKSIVASYLVDGSSDIDIVDLDSSWIPELSEYFLDLKSLNPNFADGIVPSFFENAEGENGELFAFPYNFSIPLLYYRADLLEKYNEQPPRTWNDLEGVAKRIMAAERSLGEDIWGYTFSGARDDELTRIALELIAGHGGGRIIEPYGAITVDNEKAAAAIERAASWINTITPKEVLSFNEQQVREFWYSGHTIFMRHSASGIIEKGDNTAGATTIPTDSSDLRSRASLKVVCLAITKSSENNRIASDLFTFLARPDIQQMMSDAGGWLPTNQSQLQKLSDPESGDALSRFTNPFSQKSGSTRFFEIFKQNFLNPLVFPAKVINRGYSGVSTEIATSIHVSLTKQGNAHNNLAKLQRRLEKLKDKYW